MNNWILATIFLLQSALAYADLSSDFSKMEKNSKGPFSLNYLQGPEKRTSIKSGQYPSKVYFQAAYRNDEARVLSEKYDFYVANLFTTNYYELLGEFGYGNAYGSHPLEHDLLYSRASDAMPKAAQMARSWVLEKYYIEKFSNSKLARAFLLRGISGTEFEIQYAQYFFNFYLSSMNDDLQYLVAYLLIQDSPVSDSSGLQKARTTIAKVYDDYAAKYGSRHDMVRVVYKIRNIIHNQLSPEAIDMLDDFLNAYPRMKGDPRFEQVKDSLKAYYSFSVNTIISKSEELGLSNLNEVARLAKLNKQSPESLLSLSKALADLKTDLVHNKSISTSKLSSVLSLISKTSGFLNRELSKGSGVGSKTYIEALCNVIYAEGFLIKDNWDYYLSEIQSSSESSAKSLLTEIVSLAPDTIAFAFEPTLSQWISIEKGMNGFSDNAIKSSSINAAAKNL